MPNEPVIDPETGEPKKGNGTPPPGEGNFVQISSDEWAGIKAKIDTFEKMGFNVQPQQPTPAPAAPSGPSFDDKIREIDKGIDALDSQIDSAVSDGKPVSKLLRERDTLLSKRTRMEIKHHDIDPAFASGVEVIDQLSDTVTRAQMPHLDLVRNDYDAALHSLPADQRMNPKMRQAAYNIAVGQNVTKIIEAEKEKNLRASEEPPNPEPGANSRASGNENDTIPNPEAVLSKDTMRALRTAGKTVDQHYQALGYKGWTDFYEKRGKEYFEG